MASGTIKIPKSMIFREDRNGDDPHMVFYVDYIVYIAGVDVTPWVTGGVSVTLAGRDGQNSISLTLNNANSNFVLTPRNLQDSDNSGGSWRGVSGVGNTVTHEMGLSAIYSEYAKYKMFRYKFTHKMNNIDQAMVKQAAYTTNVDKLKYTGDNDQGLGFNEAIKQVVPAGARCWPLDTNRVIFHKNDPIRVWYHNPLTQNDEWLPAFTGYLESANFSESYENGESTISIAGADIRAIMSRMRIAKNANSIINTANVEVAYLERQTLFIEKSMFKDAIAPASGMKSIWHDGKQTFPQMIKTLMTGSISAKFDGVGNMRWGESEEFPGAAGTEESTRFLAGWHLLGLLGYEKAANGSAKYESETKIPGMFDLQLFIKDLEKSQRLVSEIEDPAALQKEQDAIREHLLFLYPRLPGAAQTAWDAFQKELDTIRDQMRADINSIQSAESGVVNTPPGTPVSQARVSELNNIKAVIGEAAVAALAEIVLNPTGMTDPQIQETWKHWQDEIIKYYDSTVVASTDSLIGTMRLILERLSEQKEDRSAKARRATPYTLAEVTVIGEGTTWDGPYAPDKGYVHFLSPARSTNSGVPQSVDPTIDLHDAKKMPPPQEDISANVLWLKEKLAEVQTTVDKYTAEHKAIPADKLIERGNMKIAEGLDAISKVLVSMYNDRWHALGQRTRDDIKDILVKYGAELTKSAMVVKPKLRTGGSVLDGTGVTNAVNPSNAGFGPEVLFYGNWHSAYVELKAYVLRLAATSNTMAPNLTSEQLTTYATRIMPGGVVTSVPSIRGQIKNVPVGQNAHYGYDIAAPPGQHVLSPRGLGTGVVTVVKPDEYPPGKNPARGFGSMVNVEYSPPDLTERITVTYGHLDPSNLPRVGQTLIEGSLVGFVGKYDDLRSLGGWLSGPHLHIEARTTSGDRVDPMALIGGMVKTIDPKAISAKTKPPLNPALGLEKQEGDNTTFDSFNFRGIMEVEAWEAANESEIDWIDRFSMVNELCTKLDYQWWVAPTGDIFFEFPMADFFPNDFGAMGGSMIFEGHVKSGDYNDEASDIPTILKAQGHFTDVANAQGESESQNSVLRTVYIMVPTLMRRLGVNMVQETYPSFVLSKDGDITAIARWAMIDMQRRLSQATTFDNSVEYRPFLLPNRPIHSVPRDRLGLLSSITHSMEMDAVCTTSFSTIYVRHRDSVAENYTNIMGTGRFPLNFREMLMTTHEGTGENRKSTGFVISATGPQDTGKKK